MPVSLLYEWLAYYRIEPWGAEVERKRWELTEYRQFQRVGMILANLLSNKRRRLKVKDFIPESMRPELPAHKPPEPENPAALFQKFKMAFGLSSKQID
jgi:hypothetical protein